MLNKAPSDTQKVFFLQNYLLFFFNVHEKCFFLLYQFNIFIWKILWCCQKISFISVKYLKICTNKSFMRPRFFGSPFIQQVRSKYLPCLQSNYLNNFFKALTMPHFSLLHCFYPHQTIKSGSPICRTIKLQFMENF